MAHSLAIIDHEGRVISKLSNTLVLSQDFQLLKGQVLSWRTLVHGVHPKKNRFRYETFGDAILTMSPCDSSMEVCIESPNVKDFKQALNDALILCEIVTQAPPPSFTDDESEG